MINLTQNNIDKLKNLEHLMEKLPKTADGVIVTPGMTVYGNWEGKGTIHAIYNDRGIRVKQDGGMFYRLADEVYSKIQEKTPVLIENDIVEFIYNDEKQVVLVMNHKSTLDFINTHIVVANFVHTHVVVWNFAKQEIQTYLRSVITSVRLLNKDEYKKIVINDLPDTLQSPGDLCLDYENMGWSCYCKDGVIIAAKIKKNQEQITETKQLEIIKKAIQKFFDGIGYEGWKDKPNQKLEFPSEFPSVTCPICKTTTYHPKDVRDYLTVGLWCNNCDKRTTENMIINESNLRTQSKLSVIREIISKFQINTNIPYSHNNQDYLSAEDCLSEILQRLLDEN